MLGQWLVGFAATVRGWSRARQGAVASGVLILAIGLVVVGTQLGGHSKNVALPPTPPAPSSISVSTSASPTAQGSTKAARRASSAPKRSTSTSRKAKAQVSQGPFHCTDPTVSGIAIGAVHVCIPAIRVDAAVIPLGLNADRTIQVPPLSEVGLAGWYRYSPAPGADGPSIILGHIDSAQYGEGVFFNLGRLQSGQRIVVDGADGMVATYRVDHVGEYPKSNFPTQLVYGETAQPTIRLITCGGQFDASAGNYLDNIVAFGSLESLRRG